MGDEDVDEGQEAEELDEGADTEIQDTGEAFNRWLALIDEVSTITRQPFKEVWEFGIYEFFTYASYSRWKVKR